MIVLVCGKATGGDVNMGEENHNAKNAGVVESVNMIEKDQNAKNAEVLQSVNIIE